MTVRTWRSGPIARIRLDRPDRRNAVDLMTASELLAATLSPEVRSASVVLLDGEGPHFCAGGDVKAFRHQTDLPAHLLEVTALLHAAMLRLRSSDAPLVVAARGHVAGAGLGLACWGDVLLAATTSTFRSAYGALGLTPDAGTSQSLVRLVGRRRAERILLLGEVVDAATAHDWGLCSAVAADVDLEDRAVRTATALAGLPPGVAARTGRLLDDAGARDPAAHLEAEAVALSLSAADPEVGRRMGAF